MVKALAALLALTAVAHADDGFNMLGFRFGMGRVPIEHGAQVAVSLGLGVEHPAFKWARVFGEYEWLYLGAAQTEMAEQDRHGSGHRVVLGLRRELFGKSGRALRVFVDAELGGAIALMHDNMTDARFTPAAITGLRYGYDLYSSASDSPSRTFEAELITRLIATTDGLGFLVGIGMAWGN